MLVVNYFLCLVYALFVLTLSTRTVSNLDFPHLDTLYKAIVKDKQPFERLEMTKEDLLEMFKVWTCWCVCVEWC